MTAKVLKEFKWEISMFSEWIERGFFALQENEKKVSQESSRLLPSTQQDPEDHRVKKVDFNIFYQPELTFKSPFVLLNVIVLRYFPGDIKYFLIPRRSTNT
jgi:hypothetical protein